MKLDPRAFGDRMKEARRRKGLFQREASESLGFDQRHWTRYERGVVLPKVERLIDIAVALDVTVDWLLLGDR